MIHKDNIKEEIRLISGTKNEYISPTGKIYKYCGDNMYFQKKTFINNHNGYLYINIQNENNDTVQKRVHRLVAQEFLDNPENLPIVMHKDNNKANPELNNLKWGTVSENTKSSFDDGLEENDKGFDDSQSVPVCQFDMNLNLLNIYGSISLASKATGIGKQGIIYQCNHCVKTKPRCGFYFRYLEEYDFYGFVL